MKIYGFYDFKAYKYHFKAYNQYAKGERVLYYKKRFFLNPHAVEEFAKDNIPEKDLKYMFKIGVIIDDLSKKNTKRKLCICKYRGRFWTTVFERQKHYIVVITGYESKGWEINTFKRNKREKHA